MILAGDIGGTKTVLGLYAEEQPTLQAVREEVFPSADYDSLESMIEPFLSQGPRPQLEAACFGVAGAVIDGHVDLTNLAGQIDERELSAALGGIPVKLLNDLEAAAYGALFLEEAEFAELNPAKHSWRSGSMSVIAPGTGLGEAILYWDGERHHPIATEAGHAPYGPASQRELELLRFLFDQRNASGAEGSLHVSVEHVLSGPGLRNLYAFARHESGVAEPEWLTERMQSGDPSAAITEAGLSGKDPVCVETLDLFASVLGCEAGNMVLRAMTLGGVIVAGGIAPKILSALQSESFRRAFSAKGKFEDIVRSAGVRVVLNPRVPLLGAARFALRRVR